MGIIKFTEWNALLSYDCRSSAFSVASVLQITAPLKNSQLLKRNKLLRIYYKFHPSASKVGPGLMNLNRAGPRKKL